MFEQVEDNDASAGLQDAMGRGDGEGGMFRMVQGLAEKGEVDGAVLDGGGSVSAGGFSGLG